MSVDPNHKPEKVPSSWAPFDLTDGKAKGQWESDYKGRARCMIRIETAYVLAILLVCLLGAFLLIHQWCHSLPLLDIAYKSDPTEQPKVLAWIEFWNTLDFHIHPKLLGCLAALCGGTIGGCCFGLKCMYHFVAKGMWHEDRRLWRFLTPLLSGVLSLFMVLLVASGLFQIFDRDFLEHVIRVLAFSFLVGYFSDKALAKMSDVADKFFGTKTKFSLPSNEESTPENGNASRTQYPN